MNVRIINIDAPYFNAGVVCDRTTHLVIEVAPILKYMKGWHRTKVHWYCRKKGWSATEWLPSRTEH